MAKNKRVGWRSSEVAPDSSLNVALCEYVGVHLCDSTFLHSHLTRSASKKCICPCELNTKPNKHNTPFSSNWQIHLLGRKCLCAPVQIDLEWVLVFLHLADKECRVILHLLYKSISAKLSLIMMANTYMHIYFFIFNLKNRIYYSLANDKQFISAIFFSFLRARNYFRPLDHCLIIGFGSVFQGTLKYFTYSL